MTDLDIEQGTNHYYFENTKRRFVSRQLSHPASSRPSDDGSHNASDLEFIDYEIDLLSTPSDVDEMSQDPRNTIRKEDDEDGCDSNFDVDVDVDLSSLGIDTFTERIYRETQQRDEEKDGGYERFNDNGDGTVDPRRTVSKPSVG